LVGTATLSQSTLTTDANGDATVTATANNLAGAYQVTATLPGFSQVTFNLTNSAGTPEINVARLATNIPDNPANDPAASSATNFGTGVGGSNGKTYTISNTGTGPLTLGANAVSLTGTDVARFSVAQQPAATVAPGGSTTFQINFSPDAPRVFGPVDVAIANDDGDENPYNFRIQGTGQGVEVNVTGNGQTIADDAAHAPGAGDHTDFGSADVASGTVVRTFTIENNGFGFALDLQSANAVSISGAHAGDFTVTRQPSQIVHVGAPETFEVTFNPSATGLRGPVDVTITNDDGDESPYNFRLQGTGSNADIVAPRIASIDTLFVNSPTDSDEIIWRILFDETVLNVTLDDFVVSGTTAPITVRTPVTDNPGFGTLIDLRVVGGDLADLNGTVTLSLSPGQNITDVAGNALVNLNPTGLDDRITQLINVDPDIKITGNGPIGGGTGPELTDGQTATSVATGTDFGNQAVGTPSVRYQFGLSNTVQFSTLSTGANALTFSGPAAADFSVVGASNRNLPGSAATGFDITFTPSAVGPRNATVTLVSNDPDENPFTFNITGTGTGGAAEIEVSGNFGAAILDGLDTPVVGNHTFFGSLSVNSASLARTFTITNTGTDVLNLGANAVSVSGENTGDFLVTGQPATTVAPLGGTTTFVITFDPTFGGTRTTIVSINSDDADENPFDFRVSGVGNGIPDIDVTGNGFAIVDGDTTPASADDTDFGNADIVTGLVSHTFTITNTGTDFLIPMANAVSISGANAADFTVTTQPSTSALGGGASRTFTVKFDPSALGSRSATLSIASNDPDENPFTFALSGAGTNAPEINVTGNSQDIVDGDTTPIVADLTDFGSLDITTSTVSRTFTIQNTGSSVLTLGPNAVTLSGANAGDFTVTSQPTTTVAPGGSTTVDVQFDPSAIGVRTANLSIANDDADESPYNFALSGEGISGGTVTIVQKITGPDITVDFSSTTPALTFSLTSVSGTAQFSQQNVPAGIHSLLAEDLSASGYGISSIACDDINSTGDVASRTVTINLTSGEHVTCIFETIDTRGHTSQMIADFLGARNTLLLANQPNNDRRINRLKGGTGVSGGDSIQAFGHNLRSPVPVDVAINEDSFSFATSLKRVTAAGGEASLAANGNAEDGEGISPIDIWVEGSVSRFLDGTSGGGSFGLLSFGVDYLVEPDILLGVMAQIDRLSQDFTTPGSEIDGSGWMAGPYATVKLDEHLYLDVLGTWGKSDNEISPFGTYTDTFETDRWLVSSSLTGQFEVDNWDIRPRYSLRFLRERQFAYTDSLGVLIPAQSLSQGDMRLGPQVAYTRRFEGGSFLRPNAGFVGVYAFGERDTFSTGSFAGEAQGLTGAVNAGLDYQHRDGLIFGLSANYGGIGGAAKTFGFEINLSTPLN
jgi:Autotransporter beta-domain/HYDIN/CFA65/VesB-like, Ig-like domain